ncbi:gas vesicle protein GvpG [Candidatus Parcubacteria bacterium]|nr:gas vesicle protein GvpG [Patescibacteria group bacterium]MCG2688344.1 gas vesicle protein GvpG [Candidatus Parcubacteria bacterium]
MFIVDDILLAPIKGFVYLAKKVQELADEELEDTEEKIKTELLGLQMLFETDQISEEEYQKKEEDVLERLNVLKEEENRQ